MDRREQNRKSYLSKWQEPVNFLGEMNLDKFIVLTYEPMMAFKPHQRPQQYPLDGLLNGIGSIRAKPNTTATTLAFEKLNRSRAKQINRRKSFGFILLTGFPEIFSRFTTSIFVRFNFVKPKTDWGLLANTG